jgi:DNA-binding response OmpR family regulator
MPPPITSRSTSAALDDPRKPLILMIESDDPTVELYRRALDQEYEVITRGDEAGVMEVLSSMDLQAIIIEPAVSGGRGWNIFTAIQKNLSERTVPVIICSTLDRRKRGLAMGAAVYLVKPVQPITLIETLHELLHNEQIG